MSAKYTMIYSKKERKGLWSGMFVTLIGLIISDYR